MKRVRIILGFLILVFFSIHYHYLTPILQDGLSVELAIKQILISILSVTAIIIFISTLFRIDTDMEGRPCYDPENFYWKHLSRIFNLDNKIELCKMYWSTALLVVLGYFTLIISGQLCYGIYFVIKEIAIAIMTMTLTTGLMTIIFIALCFLLFVLLVAITLWILKFDNKYFKLALKGIGILFFILFVCKIAVFVIWPLMQFIYEMITSTNIAVMLESFIFVSMISVYLLTKLAFNLNPALKTTLIGRIYTNKEKNLCPLIYACPLHQRKAH